MWAERTACTAKKRLPTAALSPPQRQQRTTYFLQQPPSPVWPVKLKSVTDSGGATGRGYGGGTLGKPSTRRLEYFQLRRKWRAFEPGRNLARNLAARYRLKSISLKDEIARRIFFRWPKRIPFVPLSTLFRIAPARLIPVVLAPSFTG